MNSNRYLFTNRDLKMLIFPLVADLLLQALVGLTDSIMVASVGEAAVSAVSLVDSFIYLFLGFFSAVATGGAVVVGQYLGKSDKPMANQAACQLLLFILKVSLVISALSYLCKDLITHVIFGKISQSVMRNCNTYMLIVFSSIPMIALYNAGIAVFRVAGNSALAMKSSVLMNAINIAGNAVLIYGCHMGIEGVAIPTVISRGVACGVVLLYLKHPKNDIQLPESFSYRTDWKLLKKILYIAIPNGLEDCLFTMGKILLLSLVAGFGTASIAANAVANTISSFLVLPGNAMGFAMLTVAARCIGAGDYGQVAYYAKKLIKAVYISLLVINLAFIFLLPSVIRIYNLSPEASGYAYQILSYYCLGVVTIWPLSFFIPNILHAAADVKFTMVLSIVSMWVFRIGCSVIFAVYLEMGVLGVWLAMFADWLFRGICFTVRYLRGKWKHGALV